MHGALSLGRVRSYRTCRGRAACLVPATRYTRWRSRWSARKPGRQRKCKATAAAAAAWAPLEHSRRHQHRVSLHPIPSIRPPVRPFAGIISIRDKSISGIAAPLVAVPRSGDGGSSSNATTHVEYSAIDVDDRLLALCGRYVVTIDDVWGLTAGSAAAAAACLSYNAAAVMTMMTQFACRHEHAYTAA